MPFEKKQDVIAWHKQQLYFACVVDIKTEDGKLQYLIHYKKWRKCFDEWLPASAVIENNEENKQHRLDLRAAVKKTSKKGKKKEKKSKKTTKVSSKPSKVVKEKKTESRSKGRKRKEPSKNNEPVLDTSPKKLKIFLPTPLSKILVEQWEEITANKRLIPLPRKTNVVKLLANFLHTKQRSPATTEIFREIADGLIQYFDRALGTLLLYKFERPQYQSMVQNHGNKMSTCYGADHLLRLFIHYPTLVDQSHWKPEERQLLRQFNLDFMRWLENNRKAFSTRYKDTDDTYYAQFNSETLQHASRQQESKS